MGKDEQAVDPATVKTGRDQFDPEFLVDRYRSAFADVQCLTLSFLCVRHPTNY